VHLSLHVMMCQPWRDGSVTTPTLVPGVGVAVQHSATPTQVCASAASWLPSAVSTTDHMLAGVYNNTVTAVVPQPMCVYVCLTIAP
jgi:hypothetical protein